MSALATLPAPGDLLELSYLRTALLEIALISVAGGLLGAWIVLRRIAFFAHAAGSATFPGLVVADATGFSATVAGLAVALGFAAGVERSGRTGRDPGDAATGLVLVFALSLGIVLASDVYESGAAVDRLLFGTIIGLGGADLVAAAVAAVVAALATLALGRAWTATAFDPAAAGSIGIPASAADLSLLAIVGLAAVAALPAVGALLVASIFVVPAASARLLCDSVRALLLVAVAVALVQGVVGLYGSLWLDVPPGPAVAVVGTALYAAIAVTSALRRSPASRPAALETA